MKITLFTSNQSRHNYLINKLSSITSKLFVIQENRTIFPGIVPGHYPETKYMVKYFKEVSNAQNKIFDYNRIRIPVIVWNQEIFMRISIQAYNKPQDIEKMLDMLKYFNLL